MATVVYVVCAVTSIACAVLLGRAHRRAPSALFLWSTVCFALLSVNSALVVVDLSIVQDTDLSAARGATGLAGLLCLLVGLIVDTTGDDER